MGDGIIVFASRRVGLELLDFLIRLKMPILKIIIARESDANIFKLADKHGIPFELYNNLTQQCLVDAGLHFQWLLNLWSPHILANSVLGLAEKRLNIHSGLVPVCRGNDNAAWCIRLGIPAGVSLLEMNQELDSGDIYAEIVLEDIFPVRGAELHQQIQDAAVKLFIENWQHIYTGRRIPQPQKIAPINTFNRAATEKDRKMDLHTMLTLEDFLRWGFAHDFAPQTTAEVLLGGRLFKVTICMEEVKLNDKDL